MPVHRHRKGRKANESGYFSYEIKFLRLTQNFRTGHLPNVNPAAAATTRHTKRGGKKSDDSYVSDADWLENWLETVRGKEKGARSPGGY